MQGTIKKRESCSENNRSPVMKSEPS